MRGCRETAPREDGAAQVEREGLSRVYVTENTGGGACVEEDLDGPF